MKTIQRIVALCITALLVCTCICNVSVLANESNAINDSDIPTVMPEHGANVTFRLVLAKYMSYASCNMRLVQYENADSDIIISENRITVGRTGLWEREIVLQPGHYQVTSIFVNGAWDAQESGSSPRFEVKGDKMTVYVAVDSEEQRVQMPDQWLVYGEDQQQFHLWDGTPDLMIGNTEAVTNQPAEPSTDTMHPEELPGDVNTDLSEDDRPARDTAPNVPNPDSPTTNPPIKRSAQIGNIVFYTLIGTIFIVCFILLYKIKKDRGAR